MTLTQFNSILQYKMALNTEEWKDIHDYEDLYEISSSGQIRNKATKLILKSRLSPYGYCLYNLYKNKVRKTFTGHRLVATLYIPNPDNKPFVDHIDGNKINNNVSNLRWVTNAENMYNRKPNKTTKSGYKGIVCRYNKFRASIGHNHKFTHIGTYETLQEAVLAYNEKAKELFGEYAKLNVIIV